jgi:PASTA domain
MRFRPNGTKLARLIVRLAAVVIAISAMVSSAPAVAALTATGSSHSASVAAAVTRRAIPKVIGWTAADAATALHARGFGHIFTSANGHKVVTPSRWTVTKQSPKAGTSSKLGIAVTLTVVATADYVAQQVRSFYAQDYGSFPTITRTGTGSAIIALPSGLTAAIVKSTYSGVGSFRVTELAAKNVTTKRVVVSAKYSYSGTSAFGLVAVKARTAALEVSGIGSWKVIISPIASAPIIATPIAARGDHVYLYSGLSTTWTVRSPGPTTFMLNQISSSSYPNLAVNESGNWAGPVALQPGPSVIEIHSNGAWTIR